MIGLADGAPQATLPEQRNDVILVGWQCTDVHQKRRPTMIGERGGSENCPLGTVCHARFKHAAWRHRGVAVEAEVDRQPVEVILNLLRGIEACEQAMLGRGQQRMQPASVGGHEARGGSRVNDTFRVLHT